MPDCRQANVAMPAAKLSAHIPALLPDARQQSACQILLGTHRVDVVGRGEGSVPKEVKHSETQDGQTNQGWREAWRRQDRSGVRPAAKESPPNAHSPLTQAALTRPSHLGPVLLFSANLALGPRFVDRWSSECIFLKFSQREIFNLYYD